MRNNMQTGTIVKTTKFKLEFEKFKDWVYIKCSDREHPFMLPRKYFDKMEVKHSKGKVKYNWLLKISWMDTYHALSKDYLKNYFKTGEWAIASNADIVDPLLLLKANVKDRYYQLGVAYDGFLKFDGKQVLRPFTFDIGRYHSIEEVIKKLQKHPKILSVKRNEDIWVRTGMLTIIYMPSVREFNKIIAENYLPYPGLYIEPLLGIKRFRKED